MARAMAMSRQAEYCRASPDRKCNKQSPPFIEVICHRTDKPWRFAAGTKAKFSVIMINSKLDSRLPLPPATHIEAVKDGEEPVTFGPNSVLVNYGDGWTLRTATDPTCFGWAKKNKFVVMGQAYNFATTGSDDRQVKKRTPQAAAASWTLYTGKILIAFMFIFSLGGMLACILQSLPRLV